MVVPAALKNGWFLWMLAGALALCLCALWWLHGDAKATAARVGALESVNAANVEALRLLRADQIRQNETLEAWQQANRQRERQRAAKARAVREEERHEDFATWAGQSLPAGVVRALRVRPAAVDAN